MERRRVLILGSLALLAVVGIGAYWFLRPQGPPAPAQPLAYIGQTWTVFRPEVFAVAVEGRSMRLTLRTVARWAGNGQGGLVYQEASGDFKLTATVRARKASDPRQTVASLVSLGGLTARNRNGADVGGSENYVHIVVGNTPSGIGVETKTTLNGATSFEAVPGESGDAELRICRVSSTFRLYKRPLGSASWALAATYERPDLPPTLQVGANIYSVMLPDLQVIVEDLRLEAAASAAACEED